MCPFSILAFLQPTTVDKEPKKMDECPLKISLTTNASVSQLN